MDQSSSNLFVSLVQKQSPGVLYKKVFLKNFAKFKEKRMCYRISF